MGDVYMTEKQKAKSRDWNSEYGEAVGLFYGGFMILGGVIGGVLAFMGKSDISAFLNIGWIYVLVGIGAGILTGLSLGLITNGIIDVRKG
jgi:hypothetical protein